MTHRLFPRFAAVAVTLLALGAGSLRAQNSTIDTVFAVRGNARLSVQNQSGTVNVRVWNRSQIRVEAEHDRARVEFDATGNTVTARTVSRRGNSDVEFSISVPAGTALDINGLSLDVTVSGVCGPISITTLSGDVDVQCTDGDASIQSTSGDINVSDARGPLEINGNSGDIMVRGARGLLKINAISGDVMLTDIAGNDVTAEVVSGEVEFSGRILDTGRYRFAAHSGDVTLHIAGNPNATFSVSTFSGDFESDFQIQIQPGTRMGKDWEFRLGTGSARVRAESFSGTINLRRGTTGGPREE